MAALSKGTDGPWSMQETAVREGPQAVDSPTVARYDHRVRHSQPRPLVSYSRHDVDGDQSFVVNVYSGEGNYGSRRAWEARSF